MKVAKPLEWGIKMIVRPNLSSGQWLFLADAFKTVSEGIILGSLGAFFLPETFQLPEPIPPTRFFLLLLGGLIILVIGAMLHNRGAYND